MARASQNDRLLTTDTRALHRLSTQDDIYWKPSSTRYSLGRVVGDGILITEGEQHKQQVRGSFSSHATHAHPLCSAESWCAPGRL